MSSGGIAALAGTLLITVREQVTPTQAFAPEESLRVVATAVIGGLGSIVGPVLGALWVRGLPVVFHDTAQVRLFTSSIGLLILLMYFPGGLLQIALQVPRRRPRNGPTTGAAIAVSRPPCPRSPSGSPRVPRRTYVVPESVPWLAVRDVSVHFGGNHAVDHVSLEVHAGELVGLIGTNGAGKSTLMNAIGGFVPSTGRVEVLGRDVSGMPAYRRHRLGLGRGFQSARLYPAMTVRETVMVALEARERSWLVPSMTGLPPSPGRERRKRVEAEELIEFLGLGRYADEFVSNLSTGTRRIVELGTLLAVDARVLLLDEPTGGVAQREAEAFGPLIVRVQRELGAAMLVIEHDMPLIMGISDRVVLPRSRERDRRGLAGRGSWRSAGDRVVPRHRRTGDPALGRHPADVAPTLTPLGGRGLRGARGLLHQARDAAGGGVLVDDAAFAGLVEPLLGET